MAYRITTQSRWIFMIAVFMAIVVATIPLDARDVRVAYQSEDAGESVDDDPADTGEPVVVEETADDEETETLTPAERAAALERRAGEQVGDNPRGRAVVLGMHIQEGDRGRAKVVEVAAASPAFDGGIREGDEIVSFDGFTAKSYREWMDGIRKLVTDTPDGEMMTIDVVRDGKRVSTKVRAPEARADDPRVPDVLSQQITQEGPGAVPIPGDPTQAGNTAISDNDVFIADGPLFGNEFDDAMSGAVERAMAEIRRLNEPQQAAPRGTVRTNSPASRQAGVPQTQPGTPAPPAADATGDLRIGLAGFRDDQNGMMVMLDVGGLAPGTYRVAIDDPSLVMGSAQSSPAGTGIAPQGGTLPANQPATGVVSPDGSSTGTSGTGTPPGVVRGGTTPSGSRIPPTGQVNPDAGAPDTGRVLPPASTPTGLPNAEASLPPQRPQQAGQRGAPGATTPTLSEIGLLTIDQSGTGRLQQVVEGVQVRDVLGQAIVIYPPATPPQTSVPPNTNVSGIAGDRAAAPSVNTERNVNNENAPLSANLPNAAAARQVPGTAPQPQRGARQLAGNADMPVAGGIIRQMSDRRPQAGTPRATTEGTQLPSGSESAEQFNNDPIDEAGRAATQVPPAGETPTR